MRPPSRLPGRRPGRARVYGHPRQPGPGPLRDLAAAYRTVPSTWLTVGFVLLLAVVAAVAYRLDYPTLTVTGVTAAAAMVLHSTVKHPGATATVLVLAACLPLAQPTAAFYAYQSGSHYPDFSGATSTLLVLMLLVALVAHRTSRGKPWVTTLYGMVALYLAGPLLLTVLPGLGFIVGWVLAGLVLFVRGGGPAWVADVYETGRERLTRRPADVAEPGGAAGERKRGGAVAAERTAVALADLPAGYTVFHHAQVPGTTDTVDHLVLGPTGVYVVASVVLPGVVSEHPERGLLHRDRPLADVFAAALHQRNQVAAVLRLRPEEVQPLVVAHDAKLPTDRTRVALFDGDGDRAGDVLVLLAPMLAAEIASGVEVHAPRRVTRLVHRAKRFLVPTGSRPAPGPAPEVTRVPVNGVILDADGNPKRIDPPARPVPMFVSTSVDTATRVGQVCTVLTDQGIFTGYRIVAAPVVEDDGVVTVAVATEDAWSRAQATGTPPQVYAQFPLASVQPESETT